MRRRVAEGGLLRDLSISELYKFNPVHPVGLGINSAEMDGRWIVRPLGRSKTKTGATGRIRVPKFSYAAMVWLECVGVQ